MLLIDQMELLVFMWYMITVMEARDISLRMDVRRTLSNWSKRHDRRCEAETACSFIIIKKFQCRQNCNMDAELSLPYAVYVDLTK